jgi:hypothetical protein
MNNIDERTGKPKIIYHLFADMGTDTIEYRNKGYDVRCVGKNPGVENSHPDGLVYGIIANPPCTMFSIARTTAKTPRDLREGMQNVKEALRFIWECQYDLFENQRKSNLAFWAIENPATGLLKSFLGNPTFTYCQSEYGANFTKKTALWGLFNLPIRPILFNQFPPGHSLGGHYKGNEDLAFTRDGGGKAVCPYNFAKAFFETNQ